MNCVTKYFVTSHLWKPRPLRKIPCRDKEGGVMLDLRFETTRG